uniref:Putative ca2+-binding protein n=1 Tax=Panstrongylus lignarius TaxID=156445 RepID=A0A224XZ90_9HEMI
MPDHQFLWDVFEKVDKNKSGRITASELQEALSNSTWAPFNIETVRLMIRMFDMDHSGNISFKEFGSLWQYIVDWQNCFRSYDRDNTNSIDRGELATALNTFGYHFGPRTINCILAHFIRLGRGTILFDDFIRCCVQLHTMKEAFEKRDLNKDGLLTIEFEHFVEMVYTINI